MTGADTDHVKVAISQSQIV